MSVSSIATQLQSQTQSALRDKMDKALEANGLSAETASSVSSEIGTIVQSAGSAGSAAPNQTAIRAAIDTQIKADVASGKLTQDQADAVTKTLDAMDAQQGAGGGTSGGGSAPSGAAPSGGGAGSAGGSSSTKTVVSTSITTSGDKTTTVTTYSDGSTSTTVSYLPTAKSAIQSATDLLGRNESLDAKDRSTAASYLTTLLSKGLVDITA